MIGKDRIDKKGTRNDAGDVEAGVLDVMDKILVQMVGVMAHPSRAESGRFQGKIGKTGLVVGERIIGER